MECPKCGYDMEPLETVCSRCHGQDVTPRPTNEPETSGATRTKPLGLNVEILPGTISTALAAFIAGGFLVYLLSGIVTHHDLNYVAQRSTGFGSSEYITTSFKTFGFFWWFLVAVCVFVLFVLVGKVVNTRR